VSDNFAWFVKVDLPDGTHIEGNRDHVQKLLGPITEANERMASLREATRADAWERMALELLEAGSWLSVAVEAGEHKDRDLLMQRWRDAQARLHAMPKVRP